MKYVVLCGFFSLIGMALCTQPAWSADGGNCKKYATLMTTTPAASPNADAFYALEQFETNIPTDSDVVLIGDSLLAQWNPFLEKDFPDLKVWNYAVGGDRTQNVLWRMEKIDASHMRPKVVIVLIGTNNLADSGADDCGVVAGIEAVVSHASKQWPDAPIFLVSLPARGADFQYKKEMRESVNNSISKMNVKNVYPVILNDEKMSCGNYSQSPLPSNTLSCFPEKSYQCTNFKDDHLHLTENGYTFLKAAISQTSKERLGKDIVFERN